MVDWLPHARLDRAALATVDNDGTDDEDAVRYYAVRNAMHTALGTILTGFRYTIRRQPHSRLGHIIGQPPDHPQRLGAVPCVTVTGS
ncbi:hypothetical protein [Streptomyces sp. IMTB 1903]|uniref:hypothetical protein n=1 Tax=Streptomyces sp. IMTB 1903 TaxID=1776680 RepID=UPI0007541ED7|nr:hypothetical protein [Streptomyces sp. IMTB 1903]